MVFSSLNLCLVPSAGDMERAKVLKEEGNELVKKGNHKKAIEKYSESLLFSSLESATYSNRYLLRSCWPRGFSKGFSEGWGVAHWGSAGLQWAPGIGMKLREYLDS